ncbi:MAG: glutamate synthase central domain-containing protein, partial [Candidatus Omnitrophota bacterium]
MEGKLMKNAPQGLYHPQFEHDSCGVGFVCDIKGRKSNRIIRQGLEVLRRLAHRGATGADPKTGDGAGILIQIPHDFFLCRCREIKIDLPAPGKYGTGLVFLPTQEKERRFCKAVFSQAAKDAGQIILGWRRVPVNDSYIGRTAKETQPVIEQLFIARSKKIKNQLEFERKLYIIRKQVENIIRASNLKEKSFFYITNLSSRTLSYKGLLMPEQLEKFFPDLQDEAMRSAICLVHSRYSTNTFPTWDLAQPFRFLAHNGEINTLRGNINWMKAREGLLKSGLFGRELKKIFPVIVPGGSDSASIDNCFELLVLAGRQPQEAMMLLIPEAWEKNPFLDEKLKDYYRYHACLMEPWDGPAAIAFTDGESVGACLDRNGLRPARYLITKDETVIMASEVGVLDIAAQDILVSGRLEPGKIFFIDTKGRRIVGDKEVKETMAKRRPYGLWLKKNMVSLEDLNYEARTGNQELKPPDILSQLKAFGYTREDLKFIIRPMVESSAEPIGSMGDDTAHAVLAEKPQPLFKYFRQLFAQVTNPAIDPIREEMVMSLESFVGPERNLLEETPQHCHKLKIKCPILTNEELEKIRRIKQNSFKSKTISLLFPVSWRKGGEKDFLKSLEKICQEAESAIKQGYTFIILSDRGVSEESASLPSLLATGAVHHYLVKKALRKHIGIILEAGDAREVHDFALLFGYGADCINPYLAFAAVGYLAEEEKLNLTQEAALHNYIKAVEKGILKILSKMGISTLGSYRGAQIFEALGLNAEVIGRCFSGTVSRIGGVGLQVIAQETLLRHREAYAERKIAAPYLDTGGAYQWKKDGEFHLWNPESIACLQDAVWRNDYGKYKKFAALINDQSGHPITLRSLLAFKKAKPVPIEEVEPVEAIVKRFATGAMSFGSISKEAHQTIAIAMNRLGGRSNSGEGGEDPARFIPLANGDSLRSAVKQVA